MLYLGSDWVANSTLAQQTHILDGFLADLVRGPYMDMLAGAGYGVSRGTATGGATDPLHLNSADMLMDDGIRSYLQLAIAAHLVQPPDANRLYVVFVEDNIAVQADDGDLSRTDFLGYHGAFAGHNASGSPTDIRYVVVTYPGGTIGNASLSGLSAVNNMTEVASHEIAEAVTDPDVGYGALGWYDDGLNQENADLANAQYVMLDGYAVQRVADRNDEPMTPAGAAPLRPVSFVLLNNGYLYEHTASGGWTYLCSGVASVSDQTIDNAAHAMVDVVLTNGLAYEFHDGSGWVSLGAGVKQARADQGVSYVLLTNGRLFEYQDSTASWSGMLANELTSIDAGTDRYGVNLVAAVSHSGVFSECSDSTGCKNVHTDVQAVSAGSFGTSAVLFTNGQAYEYHEATGGWTYLAANVSQVTAGTDATGAAMFDLVCRNGTVAVECKIRLEDTRRRCQVS